MVRTMANSVIAQNRTVQSSNSDSQKPRLRRVARSLVQNKLHAIEAAADRKKMRLPIETAYFSAVEIVWKVDLRWLPTPVITGMIARAIPLAMRPYSMAVAPDSSLRKATNLRRILRTSTSTPPRGLLQYRHCYLSQVKE